MNCSNVPSRTPWRPAGCAGLICGATATFSNVYSCTSLVSCSGPHWSSCGGVSVSTAPPTRHTCATARTFVDSEDILSHRSDSPLSPRAASASGISDARPSVYKRGSLPPVSRCNWFSFAAVRQCLAAKIRQKEMIGGPSRRWRSRPWMGTAAYGGLVSVASQADWTPIATQVDKHRHGLAVVIDVRGEVLAQTLPHMQNAWCGNCLVYRKRPSSSAPRHDRRRGLVSHANLFRTAEPAHPERC